MWGDIDIVKYWIRPSVILSAADPLVHSTTYTLANLLAHHSTLKELIFIMPKVAPLGLTR